MIRSPSRPESADTKYAALFSGIIGLLEESSGKFTPDLIIQTPSGQLAQFPLSWSHYVRLGDKLTG